MKRNKDNGEKVTAYLLRSPKNAERLLEALREVELGKGTPESVESLRRSMGLDQKRRIGGPRLQTNDVPCHT
jgi:hypothetical protein